MLHLYVQGLRNDIVSTRQDVCGEHILSCPLIPLHCTRHVLFDTHCPLDNIYLATYLMSPTLTTSFDWDTIPSARTVIHQHKGSPSRRRHNLFAGCSTVGRLGIPVNRHGQGTPRPPDSGPIIETWTGGRKIPIASMRQATSPLIAYQLDQSERLQGREALFIRLIRISNSCFTSLFKTPFIVV
ncbi:hypothetical protein M405DRAFT_489395 [Rhizopogon salebrosus TDB-379]|nr:hypothetical protein M405DRAFT_489395 [Rhizopogon salebrosus TDB-379]